MNIVELEDGCGIVRKVRGILERDKMKKERS